MKLTILGELSDLNTYINVERANKFLGARMKQRNTDLCLWQIKKDLKVIDYPVDVICTWYTKDLMKDPDNTAFAKKFILDAIVKAGILKNDGRKQINSLHDYFEVDKQDPRCEVELKGVE